MAYKRIRNLREDKDLNQTKMGQILGMSQTGYSQYEIGKNDIPTEILRKLAIYHNTSVDYILELTDQKEPYPKSKKHE
ncbi:MAG: helix-turn-helix domain-containing protein [Defluviitaleaceae bacterium]|nr:helix-turn-helix domain-containing protein [Defluviitaleaceae bacterium]